MKTIPLLITALMLISFTPKDKGYLLKGSTKNVPQGEMIYLKVLDPNTNSFNTIDSTRLKNNIFEFKGNTEYPTYALLQLSKDITEIVVLEDGEINFKYDLNDDLGTSATGTKNNNQLNAFHNSIKKVQKDANHYRDINQDILTKAITDNDKEILEKLSQEFKVYVGQINDIITNQLKDYSDTYTSAVILHQRLDNQNIEPKEARIYYNRYKEDIKKSNIGLGIKKLIDNSSSQTLIQVGDKAIDIRGNSPEGKEISLYNSLGTITLLHFWAPWCPSCHETLPVIKELNKQYQDRGLNIFSVALEENTQEWVDTIKKEELNWFHIANLYEVQLQYGVKNIPTVFILDKNGVVIDVNHLENNLKQIIEQELDRE